MFDSFKCLPYFIINIFVYLCDSLIFVTFKMSLYIFVLLIFYCTYSLRLYLCNDNILLFIISSDDLDFRRVSVVRTYILTENLKEYRRVVYFNKVNLFCKYD